MLIVMLSFWRHIIKHVTSPLQSCIYATSLAPKVLTVFGLSAEFLRLHAHGLMWLTFVFSKYTRVCLCHLHQTSMHAQMEMRPYRWWRLRPQQAWTSM